MTMVDIQQDLGGLRSMVMGWSSSVGSLKSDLEALKSTFDRASGYNGVNIGMQGELQSLRDMVERNAGWQSGVRRELDMLRVAVDRSSGWRETAGSLRSELGALQATVESSQRGLARNSTPIPFAQGTG